MGAFIYSLMYISGCIFGLCFWFVFTIDHDLNLAVKFLWGALAAGVLTIPLVFLSWVRGRIIGKPKLHRLAVIALLLSVGIQLVMVILFSIDISEEWAVIFHFIILPSAIMLIAALHLACCIHGLSRANTNSGRE